MVLHTKLNKDQMEIIQSCGGLLRVISGPGTGKSTTCVHYIAQLINSQKAQATQILAVTFTNKASQELRDRVHQLVGRSPDVSTIHSFCAQVLRTFPPPGYSSNFTIMDEGGQFITIGNLVRELGVAIHPRFILERMTLARNLRNSEILKNEGLDSFYRSYMINLQQRDIMDYDGLLTWCLYVLERHPEALSYFSDKYKYILVDEFQDTSPIQLDIIKLLVDSNKNLMVVGDPDQSIYRFRGADVGIMVDLEKIFPAIKTYYLSQNYRSRENIVQAASTLIKNNKKRIVKPLWTERGPGEAIEILEFNDDTHEAQYIATYIEEEVKKGSKYENFAILYRVNTLGTEFETVFSKLDIPYQIIGGVGYYQRAEVRNVLAFFRLANDPNDSDAFLRAANLIAQIKGQTIRGFKYLLKSEAGLGPIDIAYRAREDFIRLLPDFINRLNREEDIVAIYELIIKQTGYLEHLRKDNSNEGERRVENIEELKSILVKLKENGRGLAELLALAEKVGQEEATESVKLMTIHGAKGLEFDTVFVVGAVKGMYPYFRAEDEEDLEEERRLFYVAVTRAKNKLLITYPKERIAKGEKAKNQPSSYIAELKLTGKAPWGGKLLKSKISKVIKGIKQGAVTREQISPGTVVYHPAFGKGYIISIKSQASETLITVEFSNQIKTLLLEYSPIRLYG